MLEPEHDRASVAADVDAAVALGLPCLFRHRRWTRRRVRVRAQQTARGTVPPNDFPVSSGENAAVERSPARSGDPADVAVVGPALCVTDCGTRGPS
jgi:hypothetical protein